jgi:hypothetical protein
MDRQSSLGPIMERNYSLGLGSNRGESMGLDSFLNLNRQESLEPSFFSGFGYAYDDDESAEKQDFYAQKEPSSGFIMHGQR